MIFLAKERGLQWQNLFGGCFIINIPIENAEQFAQIISVNQASKDVS